MADDVLSFDPAIHQPDVLKAWERFIETGEIMKNAVKKEISESWKRSMAYGIDPHDLSDDSLLDPKTYQNPVISG